MGRESINGNELATITRQASRVPYAAFTHCESLPETLFVTTRERMVKNCELLVRPTFPSSWRDQHAIGCTVGHPRMKPGARLSHVWVWRCSLILHCLVLALHKHLDSYVRGSYIASRATKLYADLSELPCARRFLQLKLRRSEVQRVISAEDCTGTLIGHSLSAVGRCECGSGLNGTGGL